MIKVSVIICTHSPRRDYIRRVLDSLKNQTLEDFQWELLVIDNNSSTPLHLELDLSWHSGARVIVEEKLGLTHARLCGIRHSLGELLVFVDDDCVLREDYLENAVEVADTRGFIGAFCGEIVGEPEIPIPSEMAPFKWYLTIAPLDRDVWSNLYDDWAPRPFGAGLCLRRNVALRYAEELANVLERSKLDRQGKNLGGCGDFDMAYTAIDMGFGIGRFKQLALTHLIPKSRISWEYLEKAVVGGDSSFIVLRHLRGLNYRGYETLRDKLKFYLDWWKCDSGNRRLLVAQRKGWKTGLQIVKGL
jgi:glycosyltransferase involved in cell wall biosynthesis